MALAKSQGSLKAWGKQKWRTKSGKKSSETGERYLPEKAIKAMSSAEYAVDKGEGVEVSVMDMGERVDSLTASARKDRIVLS